MADVTVERVVSEKAGRLCCLAAMKFALCQCKWKAQVFPLEDSMILLHSLNTSTC